MPVCMVAFMQCMRHAYHAGYTWPAVYTDHAVCICQLVRLTWNNRKVVGNLTLCVAVTTGPLCSQTYPNVPFGYTDKTGAKVKLTAYLGSACLPCQCALRTMVALALYLYVSHTFAVHTCVEEHATYV